jgi:hypothetical protein
VLRILGSILEKVSGPSDDEVDKLLKPKSRLLEIAARCEGPEEIAKIEFERLGLRFSIVRFDTLTRGLAYELHRTGQRTLARKAQRLKGLSKSKIETKFLVIHPYVWHQELAQQIIAQAWGRLGEKRKGWVMNAGQSSVKLFGADRQFEELFVKPPDAIYRLV